MKWFLFSLFSVAQISRAETWTLLIDPGHGGADRGAVYSGRRESEIVLSLGQKLKQLFQEDARFAIHLSRSVDKSVSLSERIKLAQRVGADLIVSLHANAAVDPRAKGVELFVQNPMPWEEESLFLAHQENQIMKAAPDEDWKVLSKSRDVAAIVEDLRRQNKFFKSLELSEILKKTWRTQKPRLGLSIKQAPFFVVSQSTIPAVLVEIGFLSHPQEAARLQDSAYQKEMAQIIHDGILKYLGADSQGPTLSQAL